MPIFRYLLKATLFAESAVIFWRIHIKENLPNIISSLRIISVPFLLYTSYYGYEDVFLGVLIFALISDAIDGFIARQLKITTNLGAKLDSFGDMGVYLSMPVCAFWLYPELVREEAYFLLAVVFAYTVPIFASLVKFKRVASYHTLSAKVSAVIMSIAILLIFIAEVVWPFRVAAIIQIIVGIECVLITIKLSKLQTNVKSIFHVSNKI